MKQLLLVMTVAFILPVAVFAHGGVTADDGERTGMGEGMQMMEGGMDHEEMESLMKTFMTEGKLSPKEADDMITHMNEFLTMKGSGRDYDGMMNGDHDGDILGGSMVKMNVLHGLVGVTSVVWLIAGILFLRRELRQGPKVVNTTE